MVIKLSEDLLQDLCDAKCHAEVLQAEGAIQERLLQGKERARTDLVMCDAVPTMSKLMKNMDGVDGSDSRELAHSKARAACRLLPSLLAHISDSKLAVGKHDAAAQTALLESDGVEGLRKLLTARGSQSDSGESSSNVDKDRQDTLNAVYSSCVGHIEMTDSAVKMGLAMETKRKLKVVLMGHGQVSDVLPVIRALRLFCTRVPFATQLASPADGTMQQVEQLLDRLKVETQPRVSAELFDWLKVWCNPDSVKRLVCGAADESVGEEILHPDLLNKLYEAVKRSGLHDDPKHRDSPDALSGIGLLHTLATYEKSRRCLRGLDGFLTFIVHMLNHVLKNLLLPAQDSSKQTSATVDDEFVSAALSLVSIAGCIDDKRQGPMSKIDGIKQAIEGAASASVQLKGKAGVQTKRTLDTLDQRCKAAYLVIFGEEMESRRFAAQSLGEDDQADDPLAGLAGLAQG